MTLSQLKSILRTHADNRKDMRATEVTKIIHEANRSAFDKLDWDEQDDIANIQERLIHNIYGCGEDGALEIISVIGNLLNETED